jgi:CRISPR-associated protein Csb2
MTRVLCLSASYVRGRYHGQEWPPSPAKLFQALMAGGLSGCRQLAWTEAHAQALH